MPATRFRIATICGLLFSSACDDGVHPEHDGVVDDGDVLGHDTEAEDDDPSQPAALPDGFDPAALPELETEIVARVDVGDSEVLFIAREPLAGEGEHPIIDMAQTGAPGAEDLVDDLLEQDATPLEILRHFAPGHDAPEPMQFDHERIAVEQGRTSLDVRALTTFRDGNAVVHDINRCGVPSSTSWFDFVDYVNDIANGGLVHTKPVILNDSSPMSSRTIMMGATETSGDNVAVRVCNPPISHWGGCADDRFQTYVSTWGPAGSGTVWSGKLIDCDLLKYWFGKQVDGQYYAIVVDDAERRFGVHWTHCDYGATCASRQVYMGMAVK